MWKWMGLFLKENHLLRCWDCLSLVNWVLALTLFPLLKLLPRKWSLYSFYEVSFSRICSLFLLIFYTALHGVLLSCLGWCPNCYLEMVGELQKRVYKTVGTTLVASRQPLAHRRNVASWSLFYGYYFVRCATELAGLVSLHYSREKSTLYPGRLHDCFVTVTRCYKDGYVNNVFPHTAKLWNSLPAESFLLTYDLSGLELIGLWSMIKS